MKIVRPIACDWASVTCAGCANKPLTDAGLALFKDCKRLTAIDVRKTKVTQARVDDLAKALPGCTIIHDWGITEPKK